MKTLFLSLFILNYLVLSVWSFGYTCENVDLKDSCKEINGEFYIIHTAMNMNWFQARHFCTRYKGNLVTFQNSEELEAVSKVIKDYYKESSYNRYWVSGNDLGSEGTFYAADTGKLMPYERWAPNEPNNANGTEHCVHIFRRNETFLFNDINCLRRTHPICKL